MQERIASARPGSSRPKRPLSAQDPAQTGQIGVNYDRLTPLDKQNTYSILSEDSSQGGATIPNSATTPPRPRAGKARDNLYRDTLDDNGIRILARAADRVGLADETQMLRVYVHDAMDKKDTNAILKFMPVLARIEEARIRIDAPLTHQPSTTPRWKPSRPW